MLSAALLAGCASRVRFREIEFSGGYHSLEDLAAADSGSFDPVPLLEGERLIFAVSWRRVPVGELILENHGLVDLDGRAAYHLSVHTESNRFLSRIYRIENEYHTWLCAKDGLPLKFENTIREGRRRRFESIVYDHEGGKITRESRGETSDYEIPPGAQNYFSLLYWVRGRELSVGEELQTVVNDGDKNWDVAVKILDLGLIECEPLGAVGVFALEPRAFHQGEKLEEATLRVWVSADRRRLPVAFEVNARVFGRAQAVLSRAYLPSLPEAEIAADTVDSPTWVPGKTGSDSFFSSLPLDPRD